MRRIAGLCTAFAASVIARTQAAAEWTAKTRFQGGERAGNEARDRRTVAVQHACASQPRYFRAGHDGADQVQRIGTADADQSAVVCFLADAAQQSKTWFADPEFRKTKTKEFEAAGYSSRAVEAEAFQRSLTALTAIENLIASAQRRLNSFLWELGQRNDVRTEKVRVAAEKAIAEATKT